MILVHVLNLWIDIDSLNVSRFAGPSRTDAEDQIEDDPSLYGKILYPNWGDVDGDGVLDCWDGYSIGTYNQAGQDCSERFIPIVISIPQGLDLSSTRIQIDYNMGSTTATNGTNNPPRFGDGTIRIWTKDGTEARSANSLHLGGNLVMDSMVYAAAQLGFTEENRTITLYVEGHRESSSFGNREIIVRMYYDYNGQTMQVEDRVKYTVAEMPTDPLEFISDVDRNTVIGDSIPINNDYYIAKLSPSAGINTVISTDTSILAVGTNDLKYKIVSQKMWGTTTIEPELFAINEDTGEIYLNRAMSDNEKISTYSIVIKAYEIDRPINFDTATVYINWGEAQSIDFIEDHGVLKTNWYQSSGLDDDEDYYHTANDYYSLGHAITSPEWVKGRMGHKTSSVGEPEHEVVFGVSYTKNDYVTVTATFDINTQGKPFQITGSGNFKNFASDVLTENGIVTVTFISDVSLPDYVKMIETSIVWTMTVGDQTIPLGIASNLAIYVTYGEPPKEPTPDEVLTETRLAWACTHANGQNTPEEIADSIADAVRQDTVFINRAREGDYKTWALLNSSFMGQTPPKGDCAEQAGLMVYGCQILGLDASLSYVCASTDTNCQDMESKVENGKMLGLFLNFGDHDTPQWNAYEGLCFAAGYYYAITP